MGVAGSISRVEMGVQDIEWGSEQVCDAVASDMQATVIFVQHPVA